MSENGAEAFLCVVVEIPDVSKREVGTTREPDRSDSEATILLVDDEPDVVDAYAALLQNSYDVRTATGGEAALHQVDEDVDLIFLDRRMPGMSGDELLGELRQQGYEMPVAMLTAVDPDVDIIEMPFDDYLTKPVEREQLLSKVRVLLNRAEFDETSREFYRLASKKATLEAEGFDEGDESYQELVEQMGTLQNELDETLSEMFDDDPESAFRSF